MKIAENILFVGTKVIPSVVVPNGYAYSHAPEEFYISLDDYKKMLEAKDSKALKKVISTIRVFEIPKFEFKPYPFEEL